MTELCDWCDRIAYEDSRRECEHCGDILCARPSCSRKHAKTVPAWRDGETLMVPQCAVFGGMRRLRGMSQFERLQESMRAMLIAESIKPPRDKANA